MPSDVKDIQDIIKLLEKHPEWKAEFRRILLTEELLKLPEIVKEIGKKNVETSIIIQNLAKTTATLSKRIDDLTIQVQNLTKRMDELAKRVDDLAIQVQNLTKRMDELGKRVDDLAIQVQNLGKRVDELTIQVQNLTKRMDELGKRVDDLAIQVQNLGKRVDELTIQVQNLTKRMDELTIQVQNLTGRMDVFAEWQRGEAGRREGERYERQVIKDAPYLFAGGEGGAPEDPIVRGKMSKWLRIVFEQGKELKPEERPTLADLIWWKNNKIIVVEVSLKINGEDVSRSYNRAKALQMAGADAVGVVIGEDWASIEAKEFAKEKKVEWIIGGIPSEGLIEFRKLPA